jgi:type IV pilus assembly protein PilY1
MMHVFESATGDEHFAFVPNAVMTGTFNRKIVELLNFEYTHKYLMDVTPAINDVFVDPAGGLDKSWRTMIVGGFGAGGKGYFAIDGTNPTLMTEAAGSDVVFWEFTDDDDTYPTDAHDGSGLALDDGAGGQRFDLQSPARPVKDLGYSFSVPTIAMSNVKDADGEQEWVVMFGNGFNSTAGIAKLFVLFTSRGNDGVWCHPDSVFDDDLDPDNGPVRTGCAADDQDFVKLDTGFGVPATGPLAGFPNGLGTPRGIDVDANGTLDYAYAGDSLGNLYRFDMTSDDIADWSVTKIFEAVYNNNGVDELQPIYNRPLLIEHPTEEDGFVVIFASGSYITVPDRTDDAIQTIYGIWDRLGVDLITRDDLVEQQYTNEIDPDFGNVRLLSANDVPYSITDSVFGWYNDLDAVPAGQTQTDLASDAEFPGEKAIRNIQLRGGLTFVNSVIPRQETSCTASAGGFALAFCPGTGGTNCLGASGIFDLNNDGLFNSEDQVGGSVVAGTRFEDAVPTDSTFFGGNRVTQLSDESLDITGTDTSGGANTGRLSWRRVEEL